MKIAIMTWYTYANYGTALQVTALSTYLEKAGHDVYIISYLPKEQVRDILPPLPTLVCRKIQKKIRNHFNRSLIEEHNKGLFKEYWNSRFKFTTICETQGELERLNEEFDAFICGSDQIWSPLCFDPHYFLDFVLDTKKMIAYAPSIGTYNIKSDAAQRRIRELTGRFTHLSVREKTGANLLGNLLGRQVTNVLDPTLLLEQKEWDSLMNTQDTADRYLLAYFLGKCEKFWKKTYKIAERLGLSVRIIPIFENDYRRKGTIETHVGPAQFVSLIRNAEFICTDSFHGTVFATNYNRDFCCFERFCTNDPENQNSRIYDYLEILGLQNRLWIGKTDIDGICQKIEYSSPNMRLSLQRKESEKYLNDALATVEDAANKESDAKNNLFKRNSLCCGCGACALVCPTGAISVVMTSGGFYEAKSCENQCISCGKCIEVCPIQNSIMQRSLTEGKLYSYKDHECGVLQRSSSGGIAYRLAQQMIERGYSVIGCAFDVERQSARHILVTPTQMDRLKSLQGSKYMQSEFAPILYELKDMNTPAIIFGTPCEIAAARNILRHREDVIYVDLICHGVPTYLLFDKYKKMLSEWKGFKDKVDIIFRYKPKGWRNKNIYTTDFEREHIAYQNKDEFFQFFSKGFCLMKTCYECKWRASTEADIRIGDYWGERFVADKSGVSMVMVMDKKVDDILKSMLFSMGELIKQPESDYFSAQQVQNSPRPVFWEELIIDLQNTDIDLRMLCKKYTLPYERWERLRKKGHILYDRIKKK